MTIYIYYIIYYINYIYIYRAVPFLGGRCRSQLDHVRKGVLKHGGQVGVKPQEDSEWTPEMEFTWTQGQNQDTKFFNPLNMGKVMENDGKSQNMMINLDNLSRSSTTHSKHVVHVPPSCCIEAGCIHIWRQQIVGAGINPPFLSISGVEKK